MKRFARLVLLAAMLGGIAPAFAEELPSESLVILDACDYPSAASAQAAWTPIERGTPPALSVVREGRSVLSFALNFQTNDNWRVAWDLAGPWNLSSCQTIRLHVDAEGDRPARMMLYLQAGRGWYRAGFVAVPGENTIDLLRRKFETEEQPGGWDRIEGLRIAVMREEGLGRAVFLSGIDGVSRTARVALYRNDSGVQEEPGLEEYVDLMGAALDRLSIAYEIVGDSEVKAGRLAGKKVAILPLNPNLPPVAGKRLEQFVADGGRLIVCYAVPAPLDALLGVRVTGMLSGEGKLQSFTFGPSGGRPPITPIQESWIARQVKTATNSHVRAVWVDRAGVSSTEPVVTSSRNGFYIGHVLTPTDQPRKDLLLQAMIGELWPDLWTDVCKERAARFGKIAGFKNEADVRRAIALNRATSANQASIDAWLKKADRALADVREAGLDKTKSAQKADALSQAQEALTFAYAASVSPQADEFRAVWCHSPTGVSGLTWDESIRQLAASGFNAIIPNMSWGYSAAYASKLLPKAPGLPPDSLSDCLAAAKKYGVAVHVWRVNWNLFGQTDPKQVAKLRAAGRLQVDRAGEPVDWLCPSNPENQKLELEAMVEIARNYPVAGLHFDYIRYPNQDGCFCPGCRKQFEKRIGATVVNWPEGVTTGPHRQAYRQFRRDNITQLVSAVSRQARQVRPGIKISAAVFPDWPNARDEVGQDWKVWVEKGYLDFVCPMQYTDNAILFEADTKRIATWIDGKIPLMPGIGATLGLDPDGTLQQVLAARRHTRGFVLFNYDRALFDDLELLRLGATRTQDGL